jgi:DNA-binding Lrp family transcriptional regulator
LEAYIFINTEPGKPWEVAELISKISGVKTAHAVTGQFDVVTYVEFVKMDFLREIIEKIQSIKGVRRTQTAVVMPPRL